MGNFFCTSAMKLLISDICDSIKACASPKTDSIISLYKKQVSSLISGIEFIGTEPAKERVSLEKEKVNLEKEEA